MHTIFFSNLFWGKESLAFPEDAEEIFTGVRAGKISAARFPDGTLLIGIALRDVKHDMILTHVASGTKYSSAEAVWRGGEWFQFDTDGSVRFYDRSDTLGGALDEDSRDTARSLIRHERRRFLESLGV